MRRNVWMLLLCGWAILCLAGCVPSMQEELPARQTPVVFTLPESMPTPAQTAEPTAPQKEAVVRDLDGKQAAYRDEVLALLAGAGEYAEQLNANEIKALCELAYLCDSLPLFYHPSQLEKWQLLFPLCLYAQSATQYDAANARDVLREGLAYPPQWYEEAEGYGYVVFSAAQANACIQDVWDVDIPDLHADYGDRWAEWSWEQEQQPGWVPVDVVCEGGEYYCQMIDHAGIALTLAEYWPLGEGVFYLSFDGRREVGAEEDVMQGCRSLLVRRSDSAWGFTMLAKLGEGEETLLEEGQQPGA